MLDERESVAALQQRLSVYRRTLEYLELQRAQFGAFTPAFVWHQFDDARDAIARIKSELRALGADVDDRAADSGAQPNIAVPDKRTTSELSLLSIYRRMLVDQVRYVSLAGLSAWSDLSPQLADLYVERTLIAVGSHAPKSTRPAGGAEQALTLADLARVPGARILLEGEPGGGRTTCLFMLAHAYASDKAAYTNASRAGDQPGPPLPILLNARDITAALTQGNAAPDSQNVPTPAAFWSAIERWLQYSDLAALVPTIQQQLEQGSCIVLIDDLDDFAEAAQQHAYVAALGRFVARYPDNRYVVTCHAYDAAIMAPLASFTRYRLAPIDQSQMDALVERWYAALADRVDLLMPQDIPERIAMLQGALHGDERLREVAATPRGLVLCTLAHAEGHALPQERGLVLRRLAELLLKRWDQRRVAAQRQPRLPSVEALGATERRLALLEPLALEFQSRLEADSDQPLALRLAEIKALVSENRAIASIERRSTGVDIVPDLLRWCCRHALLAQTGPDLYTMPLRPLREYLAARALIQMPDFVARAYALREDTRWRETLRLAIRELGLGPTPSGAHELLRLLLQGLEPGHGEAQRDLMLAAECLIELGERSQTERALRAGVRARLLKLVEQPACPVDQRIPAGLLLGRLGDARFVGLLPPLAHVAAGPFLLGSDDDYADEGPSQWVDLPAFAIGVYLVTNHEYAAFLKDHPAYPPPRYWHDPRYNNPACPVVGVTWHDAVAYCAWLTTRLARAGLLPANQIVRLPLEVEWEKAASWDAPARNKRRYPWGEAWDSGRANTADGRGAWMTTPVGCYLDGLSPYGLHDCIGNVWEWTASQYASYPGAAAEFFEAGRYTLRGSSCASNPTHARCTYRSRLPASYWRYHLGFRIVLGAPLV